MSFINRFFSGRIHLISSVIYLKILFLFKRKTKAKQKQHKNKTTTTTYNKTLYILPGVKLLPPKLFCLSQTTFHYFVSIKLSPKWICSTVTHNCLLLWTWQVGFLPTQLCRFHLAIPCTGPLPGATSWQSVYKL